MPRTDVATIRCAAASCRFESAPAAEEPVGPARMPRFEIVGYTGVAMEIAGFDDPLVIDLAGLVITKEQRPVFKDHMRSLIIGHTEKIEVENGSVRATAVVSAESDVAAEVVALARNNFPWQASLGFNVDSIEVVGSGERATANGRVFDGPLVIARRSELFEISLVAIGADDNTNARITAGRIKEKAMREEINTEAAASEAMASATFDPVKAAAAGAESAVEAERARVAAVIDAFRGLDTEAALKERDRCIRDGVDIAEARGSALALMRAGRPGVSAIAPDNEPQERAALEAALCIAGGIHPSRLVKYYGEKVIDMAESRPLRGAGISTLMNRVIQEAGGRQRFGRLDDATIREAFRSDREVMARAGSGFSTITVSGILSNVGNKMLLESFFAVPSVVESICRLRSLSDFKTATSYRMTGVGMFEKVPPGGEIKHVSLREEEFTNRLETYAAMITLDRQTIINDDLGAFLNIFRVFGRMSALRREESCFALLLSNPGSFFSAANGNFMDGADTALSIDSLTVAERMFRDQVDADGKPINIMPGILLVPTSLAVYADQLFRERVVNEDTSTNKPKPASNPHAGKFRPVSTPYLNAQGIAGGSAKAWYLLADPSDVAVMELATYRGITVPTTESADADFNTLGMQFRAWIDFGFAMQDPRGGVKMKGEA